MNEEKKDDQNEETPAEVRESNVDVAVPDEEEEEE